jgi:hypothetical protein
VPSASSPNSWLARARLLPREDVGLGDEERLLVGTTSVGLGGSILTGTLDRSRVPRRARAGRILVGGLDRRNGRVGGGCSLVIHGLFEEGERVRGER